MVSNGCPICGESMKTRNKYCSMECSLKGRGLKRRSRVDVTCRSCGKEFWVHTCRADNRRGRGTEAQFCSRSCKHDYWRLGNAPLTGTGKPYIGPDGYIMVCAPKHPEVLARAARGSRNNRMREHRLIMEEMLGRYLLPNETVHHKNGLRADNRKENLELWVKIQPSGQRVDDLIAYVVQYHTEGVLEKISQLKNFQQGEQDGKVFQ